MSDTLTPEQEASIAEAIAKVRDELEETKKEVRQAIPGAGVGWAGDSPLFLVFTPQEGSDGNVGIDLDSPGWMANVDFRAAGTWFLMDKRSGRPLFSVIINEGDKFWYAMRHTGNLMVGKEILSFGIGKRQSDGTIVNLWLLPNGIVCGGEDVDELAARMM